MTFSMGRSRRKTSPNLVIVSSSCIVSSLPLPLRRCAAAREARSSTQGLQAAVEPHVGMTSADLSVERTIAEVRLLDYYLAGKDGAVGHEVGREEEETTPA